MLNKILNDDTSNLKKYFHKINIFISLIKNLLISFCSQKIYTKLLVTYRSLRFN